MIIALAAATFAALYCVSGLHMAKTQIFSFFTASFGNADMMVTNTSGDALEFADGELPDKYDYLEISMTNHSFNVRNKKYYNYIDQIKTNIIGVDEDKFKSFNMINEDCDTKNGVSITAALAKLQLPNLQISLRAVTADIQCCILIQRAEIPMNLEIVS